MAQPKRVDYDRIEPDWRAGLKSPGQLAAEYTEATGDPVSRNAIMKHFEKLGVPRDLAAKIKAKADAMVAASMVTGKVSPDTIRRDAEIVQAGALAAATVQVGQRADISRSRILAMKMLAELEQQTEQVPELATLGDLLRAPDECGRDKLSEVYQKVISLPVRSKTMKDLADTLRVLIALEREAYGLVSAAEDKPKDQLPAMSDNEVARRIAFALHKGMIASKEQK